MAMHAEPTDISGETVREIVSAGILAPSGDNCQPWRISHDGGKLSITVLPEKDTSLYNVKGIASLISVGAMIENMAIKAGSLGYEVSASFFPHGPTGDVVAELSFHGTERRDDPLLPYLAERCVNRKKYRKEKLEEQHRESILESIENIDGAELHLFDDGKQKARLAKILSLNDRLLFENLNLHDFLFHHLRWTRQEVEATREGMSIESLELGGLQSRMFRTLSSWKLVQILNIFGFSRAVPRQASALCMGSSALCVLLYRGREPESFITGGRAMQRIWLSAASLGVSFHPMTGVTFLIQRRRFGDEGELSRAHQELLRNLEKDLAQIVPLDETKSIIMAFRLGYAEEPSDRSLRLPLNEILTEGAS